MSTTELPDNPVYAFAPVEDPDTGLRQIRIAVEGMNASIGTTLLVMTLDAALDIADRLNRPLGWTREGWTAFAAGESADAPAG